MPDLSNELVFHRKWWWDPIDMEIFKLLEDPLQRQLVAVSLDTQAAIVAEALCATWFVVKVLVTP
jgi:hypothetical protein